MNSYLHNILEAREERAFRRKKYADSGLNTLSLSLNIPGYPKYNESTKKVFNSILKALKNYLLSNRIFISINQEQNIIDEAGHFYIVPLALNNIDIYDIKKQCENFESAFELGRITDVDIFNDLGKPISSGKRKSCIICKDKAAVDCMREENHKYGELRALMFSMMEAYNHKEQLDKLSKKLSELATKALMYEFSLSPKPGLVDMFSSGAHVDMNYYSFINSTAALSPYWSDLSQLAFQFKGNLSEALPQIRQIGLRAEEAMLQASNNVNTQKGLVFLIGISIFSAAYVVHKDHFFSTKAFIKTIKAICAKMIESELQPNTSVSPTHGEETFKKYGLKGSGARYEAQNGFPYVFENILPFLQENIEENTFLEKEVLDHVLTTALLKIMAHINDSNILYRKGEAKAESVKVLALQSINDAKAYKRLCDYCLKEQISPGGSADMLAVSLFILFVKQSDLSI